MSNKLYIILFKVIIISSLVAFVYSCANPVIPTGGPKDIQPPIEVEAEPANYSTKFDEKSVRIWFNEFIELKDIQNQLLVSPPLKENPNIVTRGKSILIKMEDTLLENTTYTFFMGDAIVDITEKNPLKNFQYVISTGDHIDSLEVEGNLNDAFTKQAQADVMVMLYRNIADSTPMKERPVYVAKTDKQGKFKFRNLAGGGYKIFALVDANSNYLYDLPNEQIAFLTDTIFPFTPKKKPVIDTISSDSVYNDSIAIDSLQNSGASIINDSIPPDSLTIESNVPIKNKSIELLLFVPADTVQQIADSKSYKKRNIRIYFKQPTDTVELNILDKKGDFQFINFEWNSRRDSLTAWMEHFDSDSLSLEIKDNHLVLDTLVFTYFDEESKKEIDTTKVEKLIINSNTKNTIEINQKFLLEFNHPLKHHYDSLFQFIVNSDTSNIAIIAADSSARRFTINRKWKSQGNYQLLIPDSAFQDVYGLYNDSTMFKFKARNIEDYTSILLNFETEYDSTNHIIQLLNDKDVIIREYLVKGNKQLNFEYLQVKKYRLRAIIDTNANGKWDSGDYSKKKQAEAVLYYKSTIETRANWEIEQDWKINKP
ncbi:MAG: Ig-like domain-containing protein [Bacteroidales bacterium]|nr:Ig-like domain-containing protein [Bacteroidales bacterium]